MAARPGRLAFVRRGGEGEDLFVGKIRAEGSKPLTLILSPWRGEARISEQRIEIESISDRIAQPWSSQ